MSKQAIAIRFLALVAQGKIDQAFEYIDLAGRHHNLFMPADFDALKARKIKENILISSLILSKVLAIVTLWQFFHIYA